MKSYSQIVEEAKTEIPEVTVAEVKSEQDNKENDFVLLDVRDEDEYRAGYIPNAVHVTRGMLEFSIENYIPDRNQKVVVYCAAGLRSLLAAKSLREMGYTDTVSLAGGYRDWATAGYPTAQDKPMTHEQLDRYSRHFMLTEVGEQGQAKLLDAKVLMVGAGGLGSPAGVYLGAAGIGHLGIIDSDVVELSNLQRQILHRTESVGTPKVQSATTTIKSLNPDIDITPYNLRLTADNVEEIFSEYDLIVDGCDNFATRYLVNDAAVLMNKPIVHGSIFQFEGQVSLFKPHEGPCYRCMYPIPPPPGMVPSWSEAGVLGVLPGVIGVMMATEAIKYIIGIGEPLIGRLILYDALGMTYRELKINRDENCPLCGDNPAITQLIDDYDAAAENPDTFAPAAD